MLETPWLIPLAAALVATFLILILRPLAPTLGLIDQPGGRKDHGAPVPLVGGIAIFAALLAVSILRGDADAQPFLIAAGMVMLVGMVDDMHELHTMPRFLAQIAACLIMVFAADVQLRSVGDLLGWRPIGLSFFVVPMTVFAVVGVINAINMSDGMDGLAGSQGLIAVSWYTLAAWLMGLTSQYQLLLALAGGLGAFLIFNLRFPWQPRATIFMGDAGSMFLGFALGWNAIDLTQGPGRTLPPICALWVVVIPLCDTVSLISRRLKAGHSPMAPDRRHLHHLLQAKGLSPAQTVAVLAFAGTVTGGIGIGGWLLGAPEPLLFAGFVALYIVYHRTMKHAWAAVEAAQPQPVLTLAP
jgi:UDP-GlcNAc:undecaprenyl-phosphate/decaprenyl-phosphate GlcNAc-1-phosphate transferase